jgi:hypothetical protein
LLNLLREDGSLCLYVHRYSPDTYNKAWHISELHQWMNVSDGLP